MKNLGKKAIVVRCIDNFNNYYNVIVVCDAYKVEETAESVMRQSTEYLDYEVQNVYFENFTNI